MGGHPGPWCLCSPGHLSMPEAWFWDSSGDPVQGWLDQGRHWKAHSGGHYQVSLSGSPQWTPGHMCCRRELSLPSLSIQLLGPLFASGTLPRGPQGAISPGWWEESRLWSILRGSLGQNPPAFIYSKGCLRMMLGTLWGPILGQGYGGDSWTLPSVPCFHGVAKMKSQTLHCNEERSLGWEGGVGVGGALLG